mmetsp:Transcript_34885/g.52684  ORF Transcript_34885/g.52684 Transcript_34885/m.52684 type:complete len:95 (+) Transcript_34885:240-524(+)
MFCDEKNSLLISCKLISAPHRNVTTGFFYSINKCEKVPYFVEIQTNRISMKSVKFCIGLFHASSPMHFSTSSFPPNTGLLFSGNPDLVLHCALF